MYIGDQNFIHATARENKPWIRISNLLDLEWSSHPDAYYPYRQFLRYPYPSITIFGWVLRQFTLAARVIRVHPRRIK